MTKKALLDMLADSAKKYKKLGVLKSVSLNKHTNNYTRWS